MVSRRALAAVFLFSIRLLQAEQQPDSKPVPHSSSFGQHLEFSQRLELVGQSDLGGAPYGDIWVHGAFAYVGTRGCGGGVRVVDVSNPAAPELVSVVVSTNTTSYEDVAVISANTPAFQGTLLAAGLQPCSAESASSGFLRGVEFWDVTDPRNPAGLGFFFTGSRGAGVHELHLFQREERIFALLAVPFSELLGEGGDFRIVEATDPRNPRQVGQWRLFAQVGAEVASEARGASPAIYCHSAWANQEGTIAYLSYWDAGVIILDIADPARPRLLGRIQYPPESEGNTHSAWGTQSGNVLLVADEDYAPGGVDLSIIRPEGLAGPIRAVEGVLTPLLCGRGPLEAEVAYVGRGCARDRYASNASGRIALVDSGDCPFAEKIVRAQREGSRAVIMIAATGTPPFGMGGDTTGIFIPGVMVSAADADRLKLALGRRESVRARLTPDPTPTWGFLRLYDVSEPAEPRLMSTFSTELTAACPPPDNGLYSVHNPFVLGDTAFASWYAEGVRMLDLTDPYLPQQVGFFVPPVRSSQNAARATGSADGIWGVYATEDLVFLSDIENGIYILRRQSRENSTNEAPAPLFGGGRAR
ncbi:MAG: hypothetical protein HYX74_06475 [Acidobacteria bacterium]|nr:hypothetical protein [Acidobacteriota bacterium]